jgi:hypothetical protein
MPDYRPGASHPDLSKKVDALRGAGLSVAVSRMDSQLTRQDDGAAYPPSWLCSIESPDGRIATGEGTDEHQAFEEAYAQLRNPPV